MIKIRLAYYNKKDWKRLLKIIDDRESMHSTWKDWHKAIIKTKKDLISRNFEVEEIEINLDELISYCQIRGIKNDGKARSEFVQTK